MTSLGSWGCGGIAHVAGTMLQRESHRLFRKDRLQRWGCRVALYVREKLECMELCLGTCLESDKSLWLEDYQADQCGGYGYLLWTFWSGGSRWCLRHTIWRSLMLTGPDLRRELEPTWYLLEGQCSSAILPPAVKISWDTNGNFLACVIEEQTRKFALLVLILTNKEELITNMKVRDCLRCSVDEVVEFKILRGGSRAKSRTKALDFRREYISFFRDLFGSISWDVALGRRWVPES